MTLIEVLIASVMVAIIAVGTFTAFDAAGKTSVDQRAHSQATLLVQQDQERLRGNSTTTLEQLGTVETYRAENGMCLEKSGTKYVYWNSANSLFCEKVTGFAGTTYIGTPFTVTSSASYVSAEKGGEKAAFTCEKSGGAANYIQTKSSVTWSSLKGSAVSQSSVINVPSSYVLLVKVINQNKEAIEGATVSVTGGPSANTPSSGCVTFGGLGAGPYEISASKGSDVDAQGKYPPAALTGITLSPTAVTEETFTLAEPGTIAVEFESNGVATGITTNSFTALNTEMKSPDVYVEQSASPVSKLSFNKAFPFKSNNYRVWAGECEANNPKTVTESGEKIESKSATVTPGATTTVKVEAPAVNVTVYEGTEASKGSALKGAESAYITNEECKTGKAQNLAGTVVYQHPVALNTNGELETSYRYQPYAKELVLCVISKAISSKYYRNTFKIANIKKAGTAATNLYLKGSGYKEASKASELKCP